MIAVETPRAIFLFGEEAALIQVGDGTRHYVITISAMTGRAVVTEGVAEEFGQDTVDLDEQTD